MNDERRYEITSIAFKTLDLLINTGLIKYSISCCGKQLLPVTKKIEFMLRCNKKNCSKIDYSQKNIFLQIKLISLKNKKMIYFLAKDETNLKRLEEKT